MTEPTTEYIIVYGKGSKALTSLVNKKLTEGYQLLGGPTAIPETHHDSGGLYQAMTKDNTL